MKCILCVRVCVRSLVCHADFSKTTAWTFTKFSGYAKLKQEQRTWCYGEYLATGVAMATVLRFLSLIVSGCPLAKTFILYPKRFYCCLGLKENMRTVVAMAIVLLFPSLTV